jgi:hypothetical protein
MGPKVDEERARWLLREWRSSGLGATAFAKRERVSVRSLYRWRDRFGQEPEFAAVVVRPAAARPVCSSEPFVIDLCGGRSLRVVAGFDATELARLVAVLEGDRC